MVNTWWSIQPIKSSSPNKHVVRFTPPPLGQGPVCLTSSQIEVRTSSIPSVMSYMSVRFETRSSPHEVFGNEREVKSGKRQLISLMCFCNINQNLCAIVNELPWGLHVRPYMSGHICTYIDKSGHICKCFDIYYLDTTILNFTRQQHNLCYKLC